LDFNDLSLLSEKETIRYILNQWQQRALDETKNDAVEKKEFEQLYKEFVRNIKRHLKK